MARPTASCLVGALVINVALAQSTPPSPPQPPQPGIGYQTVAGALAALRSRPDSQVSIQGGWTIITSPTDRSLWSFTPAGHPAHPAVVKRTVVEKDGSISVQTNALCEADKTACDKLIDEFRLLNDRVREDMQNRTRGAK